MTQPITATTPVIINEPMQDAAVQQIALPPAAPSLAQKLLTYGIVESIGMGVNYAASYGFTKVLTNRDPHAHGVLSALTLPASQISYPVFRKLFRCTPQTETRLALANQFANITSLAAATFGAYQLGCNIDPEYVLKYRTASLCGNSLIKIANASSEEEAYKHIPELVSGTALSTLFAFGISYLGFPVDPYQVMRTQAQAAAFMLIINQAFQMLNTATKDQSKPVEVPVAAMA